MQFPSMAGKQPIAAAPRATRNRYHAEAGVADEAWWRCLAAVNTADDIQNATRDSRQPVHVEVHGSNARTCWRRPFLDAALAGLSGDWFLDSENSRQLGAAPHLIGFPHKIHGSEFAAVDARHLEANTNGQVVNLIHLEDLVANKMVLGSLNDAADLEQLSQSP